MIYSGIDWSGSPGDPAREGQSPYVVVGLAQVDGADVPSLANALHGIRTAHRLGADFSFRYSNCSNLVRAAFFRQMTGCAVTVYVTEIDKRGWYRPRRLGRPNEWLDEAIAGPVCACPPATVTGQVLIIDRMKSENAAVLRTAECIKSALKASGHQPFPKIKSRPDDRDERYVVQVADMFAGAFRDQGHYGAHLSPLRRNVVVV